MYYSWNCTVCPTYKALLVQPPDQKLSDFFHCNRYTFHHNHVFTLLWKKQTKPKAKKSLHTLLNQGDKKSRVFSVIFPCKIFCKTRFITLHSDCVREVVWFYELERNLDFYLKKVNPTIQFKIYFFWNKWGRSVLPFQTWYFSINHLHLVGSVMFVIAEFSNSHQK